MEKGLTDLSQRRISIVLAVSVSAGANLKGCRPAKKCKLRYGVDHIWKRFLFSFAL